MFAGDAAISGLRGVPRRGNEAAVVVSNYSRPLRLGTPLERRPRPRTWERLSSPGWINSRGSAKIHAVFRFLWKAHVGLGLSISTRVATELESVSFRADLVWKVRYLACPIVFTSIFRLARPAALSRPAAEYEGSGRVSAESSSSDRYSLSGVKPPQVFLLHWAAERPEALNLVERRKLCQKSKARCVECVWREVEWDSFSRRIPVHFAFCSVQLPAYAESTAPTIERKRGATARCRSRAPA